MSLESTLQFHHEVVLAELHAGNVDGNTQSQAGGSPGCGLLERPLQHPLSERLDQTLTLGDRNEARRTDQAHGRMPPAQQRLHGGDLELARIDLGLEEEFKLSLGGCFLQFARDGQFFVVRRLDARIEHRMRTATAALDGAHGCGGLVDQARPGIVLGRRCQTDRHGQFEIVPVHVEGCGEGLGDAQRELLAGLARRVEPQRELVARHTGQRRRSAGQLAQTCRDADEHLVGNCRSAVVRDEPELFFGQQQTVAQGQFEAAACHQPGHGVELRRCRLRRRFQVVAASPPPVPRPGDRECQARSRDCGSNERSLHRFNIHCFTPCNADRLRLPRARGSRGTSSGVHRPNRRQLERGILRQANVAPCVA